MARNMSLLRILSLNSNSPINHRQHRHTNSSLPRHKLKKPGETIFSPPSFFFRKNKELQFWAKHAAAVSKEVVSSNALVAVQEFGQVQSQIVLETAALNSQVRHNVSKQGEAGLRDVSRNECNLADPFADDGATSDSSTWTLFSRLGERTVLGTRHTLNEITTPVKGAHGEVEENLGEYEAVDPKGDDDDGEEESGESKQSDLPKLPKERMSVSSCPSLIPVPTTPSRPTKRKHNPVVVTEEPWHALTMTLTRIVNGERNVPFPEPVATMIPIHARLFDHASMSLREYLAQSPPKDVTLLKDAQVAMSCVLNTMSKRVCMHFREPGDEDVVEKAKSMSTIPDFDNHPCIAFLQKYVKTLAEKGIRYLRKTLIIERGALQEKHIDEESLSGEAEMADKILRILISLCDFVIRPPSLTAPPSENDCLLLWVAIFAIIADKVSLHTGEKALDASKLMRQRQSEEYSDTSEAGRKVDCLFMFQGIELSNIEFKQPELGERDLGIQNRKNVRLARCIQEAHLALGVADATILMADISVDHLMSVLYSLGFVGVFYQLMPMGEIVIAGKAVPSLVHLPQTEGGLEVFLEGSSLAIIWNFITCLEQQGSKILRAKERFEVAQRKEKLALGLAMSRCSTPPRVDRIFKQNVTLTPTKKRTTKGKEA